MFSRTLSTSAARTSSAHAVSSCGYLDAVVRQEPLGAQPPLERRRTRLKGGPIARRVIVQREEAPNELQLPGGRRRVFSFPMHRLGEAFVHGVHGSS